MFTGLIEAVGEIATVESRGGDVRIRVAPGNLDLADVSQGDSISVNGVCLTVTDLSAGGVWMDVSGETLARTTLGNLVPGARVNLEKALLPTTRLGGHLVSGHVDGVGEVLERRSEARSERFRIRVPDGLARYVAPKGSIAVDGTSLTVNAVEGAVFDVNIIPHTLAQTIIADYRPGTRVNLEVDLVARYIERLLLGERAAQSGARIDREFLARHGFLAR